MWAKEKDTKKETIKDLPKMSQVGSDLLMFLADKFSAQMKRGSAQLFRHASVFTCLFQ